MEGPGKYDDICTIVRENTQALGAIIIVIGGNKGSGFSVQTISPNFASKLPKILRLLADDLEDERNKDKLTSV